MIKNFLTAFVTLFVMVFGSATFTSAQTAPSNFPNVKIRNFGQMDERFYRGAQPLQDDFQALKDLGVKTVIDLRNDPTEYEKAAVEALGMRYINIPMSGWKTPKDRQVEEFLKIANDPETGKFFVHCKAGIHRTGVAGAVYRFTKYGWGYDQAYKEMKNYDFSSGLVHGALKSYVRDYAREMEAAKKLQPSGLQEAIQTAQ
jgi:protein tyrosine/serine phosphatase